MTYIAGTEAPTFELDDITVVGLAAPSRGSSENCAWTLRVRAGTPGVEHSVDREEIFIGIGGSATATVDGRPYRLGTGDALIVPANTPFSIANPGADEFTAVCVLPIGGVATMPDGQSVTPPWSL
ncbi:MAG TPA: cupin domain-containing protein [Pseudonocardiaceae bacterium]|jgi:mannose-6-phosphate isomerase-like protein (cupin superfamily)|nr:cupin domain-containing protein [Pseudonocardiaceae bacterium]